MDLLKARLLKNFKRQRHSQDRTSSFPADVYYEILPYLSPRDLWRYRRVSKTFRGFIEGHIVNSWTAGWCIDPAVKITPHGQEVSPYEANYVFRIVKANSWDHRAYYWDLVSRHGDILEFRMPANAKADHDFRESMKKRHSFFTTMQLAQSARNGDADAARFFALAKWVQLVAKTRLKFTIQTPEFDIGPNANIVLCTADAPEVKMAKYFPAGFAVRYEGNPALLINWRTLFLVMFYNDDKLRYPPPKPLFNFLKTK